MIQDVDDALRTLVRREAVQGGDVDVAFDAPTKEWSSRRNVPTIDLYLYDIREDLQRREVMWQAIRDQSTGFVTDRRPPPRYYKLSYLVTAWTQRPEDEHRLLSALLSCFIRHEVLPDDMLGGALAGSLPVFATIALPPPSDRPLSDVWSALGGELKPSLDLVIAAPLVDAREEVAGPPVKEEPRISLVRPRRTGAGAGGAGATGAGASSAGAAVPGGTGALGAGAAGAGDDTTEAEGAAGGRRRRRGRPLTPEEVAQLAAEEAAAAAAAEEAERAAAEEAAAAALPDETIRSGSQAHPGRVVRLHVKRPPQ